MVAIIAINTNDPVNNAAASGVPMLPSEYLCSAEITFPLDVFVIILTLKLPMPSLIAIIVGRKIGSSSLNRLRRKSDINVAARLILIAKIIIKKSSVLSKSEKHINRLIGEAR